MNENRAVPIRGVYNRYLSSKHIEAGGLFNPFKLNILNLHIPGKAQRGKDEEDGHGMIMVFFIMAIPLSLSQ